VNFLSFTYKVGSWSFILVGVGHLATATFAPSTPEKVQITQTMKEFPITMLGTDSNLLLFHEGFSLMMGVLLMGYGVLSLLHARKLGFPEKEVIWVNILISLVALILSMKYFFIVPTSLLGLALLCFSMTLVNTVYSASKASIDR